MHIYKWITVGLLFGLINVSSHCQTFVSDLTKKEQKLYQKARKEANNGKYKESNKAFLRILETKPDFIEGIMRLGSNYYSEKEYEKAEALFTKAISVYSDGDSEMYFSLASVQTLLKKYREAATNWDLYIKRGGTNTAKLSKAKTNFENNNFIANALNHPVPFDPESLGPGVNTELSEYHPFLSLDGTSLLFTRLHSQEDFYVSTIKNDTFQQSEALSGLNTYQNEGALTMSADGRYMVFTACDRHDAFGGCDLYFSTFENGQWNKAINMGHTVNSAAWDSQPCLSPDGRTLFFASNRLGTLGGKDIWKTYRDKKGKWVIPQNLGNIINTVDDDETPFLHPDGVTLYLTSKGRPGMGSADLYCARREGNSWSEPQNLGYPINSEGLEGPLCVSLDGSKALFSSDYNYKLGKRMKNLDIYQFELPLHFRPVPSTYIKGYVIDELTKKPISGAQIRLRCLADSTDFFVFETGKDGYFITSIPSGREYAFIGEKPGYVYMTKHIDVSSTIPMEPYLLTVELSPIPKVDEPSKGKDIVLNNIFFETGSDLLLQTSDAEIELITNFMIDNPDVRIRITGHTDNVGADSENLALSFRRAKAVIDAISRKGISIKRLESDGKGETASIDTNETAEGRHRNRRTEFRIL